MKPFKPPVVDYSELPPAPAGPNPSASRWRKPPHVFFGKKLPDGTMEEEPEYVHQEYPRMMYFKNKDGSLKVRQVNNDDECSALGSGWKKSAAEHGVVTCPSFEQMVELGLAEEDDPRAFAEVKRQNDEKQAEDRSRREAIEAARVEAAAKGLPMPAVVDIPDVPAIPGTPIVKAKAKKVVVPAKKTPATKGKKAH